MQGLPAEGHAKQDADCRTHRKIQLLGNPINLDIIAGRGCAKMWILHAVHKKP